MSTVSLTTWWLRSWSLLELSFGLVRITMVMCSQTSWHRVSEPQLFWQLPSELRDVADELMVMAGMSLYCLQVLVLWDSWHQCYCVLMGRQLRLKLLMAPSPGTTVNIRGSGPRLHHLVWCYIVHYTFNNSILLFCRGNPPAPTLSPASLLGPEGWNTGANWMEILTW